MKKKRGSNFDNDYAYGREAEIIIAEFLSSKGWNIKFAEDYGFFLEDKEFGGPRISYIPIYESPSTQEEIETSFITVVAPDLYAVKPDEKKSMFVEVKRRGSFSRFNDDKVIYLDTDLFYQYCEIDDTFGNVVFYLYIDVEERVKDQIYSSTIRHMRNNIQYETEDFVSFNKKIFKNIA